MFQSSSHIQDWDLLGDFLRERGLEGADKLFLLLGTCLDGSGGDVCLTLGLGGRDRRQGYSLFVGGGGYTSNITPKSANTDCTYYNESKCKKM